MRGQTALQTLDLIEAHVGAGRIVRIGEKYDLGALAHRGENGIHVGRIAYLRRYHGGRAGAERRDGINKKAVSRMNGFVAVLEVGISEQIQQIVGPGAANNAVGIESK